MPQLFANNAASTLAAAITAADTSLTLATGTGSKFPSPAAGDFFLLTLTQAGQETSWEIVKVTARAGDVLTVVRAQEGGVAAAWGIGAKAELRITAGALDAKQATLVSGTNIKTINGNSVLGSGDLVISGGGGGSPTLTIDNKTSAYTVVASDLGKIINCTSGTFTVSLTAAATLGAGFNCWIWNTSNTATDAITIDPVGTETIDGVSTLVLRRGEGLQIISDGANIQTGDKKAMRGYAENINAIAARTSATGNGAVAIGYSSAASGDYSVGLFGSPGSNYSAAIGANSGAGKAITSTGHGAMALGGSYASGTDSFAAAITNNTSSYGATGANSVVIGYQNRTGQSSAVVVGGLNNWVFSGSRGAIFGGENNTVYASHATVLGGQFNNAAGVYSVAFGAHAFAAFYGKQAFASGRFASNGDAQSGKMVLRVQSTSASLVEATSDGLSGTTANRVIVPGDSTFAFTALVVARNTVASEAAAYEFKGCITRDTGVSTTAFIGTPAKTVIGESVADWDVNVYADNTSGALRFLVTGENNKTINWVVTVWTTEVTG